MSKSINQTRIIDNGNQDSIIDQVTGLLPSHLQAAAAQVTTGPAGDAPTFRRMKIESSGNNTTKIVFNKKSVLGGYNNKNSHRQEDIDDINLDEYIIINPEKTRGSNWRVRDGGLRCVPPYYPIEKSSRFVTGATPSVVAARISECLRIMSVAAKYDHEMATALLKTADFVEMHVHLFQGSPPDYSSGIIVEIQRRRGESVLFHRYSRSILDAAEGDWDADMFENALPPEVFIPDVEIEDQSKKHENVLVALEIAGGLLKKDRLDANRLGMESMCLLTDPKKTGPYTAVVASRVVLLGTAHSEVKGGTAERADRALADLDESHNSIRESVLSYVHNIILNDSEGKEDEITGEFDEYDEADSCPEDGDYMDMLHNLALTVLANSLDVLTKEKLSEDNSFIANTLLKDTSLSERQDLISCLVEELKRAASRPHDAFLSAKCLGILVQISTEARNRARVLDALTVVSEAKDIGRGSHERLARESENVFATLIT